MKPQTKEDVFLHKKIEELEEIDSPALRKKMRESRRRVKRAISKTHRRLGDSELKRELNNED